MKKLDTNYKLKKIPFTVEHADKVIDTIIKILEDRHNVKITYRIVERDTNEEVNKN